MNAKQPLIPAELLLSLTATPFLAGLVVARASLETVQEFGKLSEEMFRGDRLPLLPSPETSD